MKPLWLFCLTISLVAPMVSASGGELQQENVSLEKILQHPEAFKNLTVSFVAQFHRLGKVENPVYSKFDGSWYQNFAVWSDTQELWKEQDYKNDFQYCFILRSSEGTGMIARAEKYSRWVFTGVITDVVDGKPWIDIEGMKQLDTSFNLASLKNMVSGYRLVKMGREQEAANAFHLADAPTLPTNIRTALMHDEAWALHRAGKSEQAVERLLAANELIPDHPKTLNALAIARAGMGLDPDGNPIPVPTAPEGIPVDVSTQNAAPSGQTEEPTASQVWVSPPNDASINVEPAPSHGTPASESSESPRQRVYHGVSGRRIIMDAGDQTDSDPTSETEGNSNETGITVAPTPTPAPAPAPFQGNPAVESSNRPQQRFYHGVSGRRIAIDDSNQGNANQTLPGNSGVNLESGNHDSSTHHDAGASNSSGVNTGNPNSGAVSNPGFNTGSSNANPNGNVSPANRNVNIEVENPNPVPNSGFDTGNSNPNPGSGFDTGNANPNPNSGFNTGSRNTNVEAGNPVPGAAASPGSSNSASRTHPLLEKQPAKPNQRISEISVPPPPKVTIDLVPPVRNGTQN